MIKKFRNKSMLIAAAAVMLMYGCGDGKAGNDGDAETLNAIENISVQEEVSQEENMPDQEEDAAQGDVPAQENISTEKTGSGQLCDRTGDDRNAGGRRRGYYGDGIYRI